MAQILDLAFPFFALILFGFAAARLWGHGEAGLEWLNTFLIWFALPALIFLVIADAPFETLVDWPFIAATTSVTATAFLTVFIIARFVFGYGTTVAALQGTAGSYGNVGYMGLPLAVAFFGPQAAVPAALVFCFDCTLQFTLTALLATLGHAANEDAHWSEVAGRVLKQVFGHPFIIATILGGAASASGFEATGALDTILRMLMNAAGPVALFALGVTVGLREMSRPGPELPRPRRHEGSGSAAARLRSPEPHDRARSPVAPRRHYDGGIADGLQRLHPCEPVSNLCPRRLDHGHRHDAASPPSPSRSSSISWKPGSFPEAA